MNARELRIGNFVKCSISNDAAIYSVWSTSYTGIYLSGTREGEKIPPVKVKPIPLTEEWLVKFGFEKCTCGGYKLDKIPTRFHLDSELMHKSSYVSLKHVHQLQNLYFALTGQELEVKP